MKHQSIKTQRKVERPIYYKVFSNEDDEKKEICIIPIYSDQNIDDVISKSLGSFSNLYKDVTVLSFEKLEETCIACILNRPGQNSHQEIGGCLYEESD
ncbi:MAG TPA: hypothetical protein PKD85_03050 [Saprospiraceae bacterium]|nr:hypothetical protein [Saprospiraceae bacterium]